MRAKIGRLQCWEVKGEARKWLSSLKKRVLWEVGSIMDVVEKSWV